MRSRRFPTKSASDCLRFAKFQPQFCEYCGAIYRCICEIFSAFQSACGPVTEVENSFQTDPLATLSILKLVRNWPKNAVLNLALCCGAIWRHREKQQYRCTTTIHPVYNYSKKNWKIYFLYDFWCAQTCTFRAVFGPPMRNLTLAISVMSRRAEKNLYRYTSTVSALNYCSRIFFKTLSYTKWCAQTFQPIFWIFAIFDRNFAKIVAPPSDEYAN